MPFFDCYWALKWHFHRTINHSSKISFRCDNSQLGIHHYTWKVKIVSFPCASLQIYLDCISSAILLQSLNMAISSFRSSQSASAFITLKNLGVTSKFRLLIHTPFFSTNENAEQARHVWLCWWPPSSLRSNLLFLPSVSWLTCLCLEATIMPLFFSSFPSPFFHSFAQVYSTWLSNILHYCPHAFYIKNNR